MTEFKEFFYWFCFEQTSFGIKKIPNGPREWVRWSNGSCMTFENLYQQFLKEKK